MAKAKADLRIRDPKTGRFTTMKQDGSNAPMDTKLTFKILEPIVNFLIFAFSIFLFFGAIGIAVATYFSWKTEIHEALTGTSMNDVVIYIVSWLVLLAISCMAVLAIREILNERAEDKLRKRSNYIAIMIGLVLTIYV